MKKMKRIIIYGGMTFMGILWLCSCQKESGRQGIHVMFDGVPKIYHEQVYFRSQVVGRILANQQGSGSITKVTIRMDPKFEHQSGRHWAFYVDNGRLSAGRLSSSGEPIGDGDQVLGFISKTDFTWFKFKSLLGHRVSKANRRAEKLYQRFEHSG